MKRTVLFWIIAFLITVASAVYQRVTGPSYPKTGYADFDGKKIEYKLERSHLSTSNYVIELKTGDPSIRGTLKWRRNYKEREPFNQVEMTGDDVLHAELPAMVPLEKVQYYIDLHKGTGDAVMLTDKPVILRFKGDVPILVLIPHILVMFFAMMLSTRCGLEIFNSTPNLLELTKWTIISLLIGGFVLGFLMNYYAFGMLWGGVPIGNDITDNKTLITFLGWLIAYYLIKKDVHPKLFAALAALLMIMVYSIPHSV
jgi:hypothetical protein